MALKCRTRFEAYFGGLVKGNPVLYIAAHATDSLTEEINQGFLRIVPGFLGFCLGQA